MRSVFKCLPTKLITLVIALLAALAVPTTAYAQAGNPAAGGGPSGAPAAATAKPGTTTAPNISAPVKAASKPTVLSEWCRGNPVPEGQGSFVAISAFKPEIGVKKTIYLVPDSVAPVAAYTETAEVEAWTKANATKDLMPMVVDPKGVLDAYLNTFILIPSGGYTVVWDEGGTFSLIGWLAARPNTKDNPVKYLDIVYVDEDGAATYVCVKVGSDGKPVKAKAGSTTGITGTLRAGSPPAGGIMDSTIPLFAALAVWFAQIPLLGKVGIMLSSLLAMVAAALVDTARRSRRNPVPAINRRD